MKTHVIRYFVALAEERHFGRAAQRLCITQPPLSMALKALEQELGVVLMERDAKNVRLTLAGEAFLLEARKILAHIQHATDVVQNVAAGKQGRLDIGITGSMIYRKVPALCESFRSQRPLVELCLHETSTHDQLQSLLRGELDVGFMNIGILPEGLEALPIGEEPLVCCLPEEHALAGSASVDLQMLANDTFVMFSRDVSPAAYDNVIACLHHAGVHPRTRHAARQWLTVIGLVSVGQGVALVPRCMEKSRLSGVRFVALQGRHRGLQTIMAWRRDCNANTALEGFIELVRGAVARG